MIIFLYGLDTFRSKEKLRLLKGKFIKEIDRQGVNIFEFNEENFDFSKLQQALASDSLFLEKKMVICRQIVGQLKNVDEQEKLIDLLAKAASRTIIIFWETTIDKRTKIFQFLLKQKFVYQFSPLNDKQLIKWVKQRAKLRQAAISDEAVAALLSLTNNNLFLLAQEIDKLAAFKLNKIISVNDVNNLVAGFSRPSIFEIVEAIVSRRKGLALQLIRQELSSDLNPLYLQAMLVRQFRILFLLKEHLAKRSVSRSYYQLANQLGLHPFVVKKSLPLARLYDWQRLRIIYNDLLQLEQLLKTTTLKPVILFTRLALRAI